jgi:hypothetical protein
MGILNLSATALFATSLVLRKKKSRMAGRTCAALGYAVMTYAAHLGGEMVYKDRVGVDRTAGQTFPEEFTAILPETELPDDKPTRALHDSVAFCWFGGENRSLPWPKHAPTSVDHLRKANLLATVLFVRITILNLPWKMAGCSMAQQCIHSLAWRSASVMG